MADVSTRKKRGLTSAPSLSRMVVVSLLIHFVGMALLVVLPRVQTKRIFYAPVMTVSLVEQPAPGPAARVVVEQREAKPVPKKPEPKKKVKEVSKKKIAKAEPIKKREVIKPKKKVVAREPVKLARRLDVSRTEPPIPAKRAPVLGAKEVERANEPEAAPRPKVEKKEEVEEKRRQWMRQQQERERQMLTKVMEDIKEPEPAEVAQPSPSPSLGIRGGGSIRSGVYNIQFKAYLNAVREKVRTAWVLPDSLAENTNLTTIVAVRINRDGTLAATRLEEASGNLRYDETVLRAIAKAAPLPPLPEEYRGEFMELGFRFRPEGVE